MKKTNILLVPFILLLAPCTYSQNIGMGTTTPSEKLHVAGNVKADTVKPNAIKLLPNAGNGKILTSDATGNASWQESSAGGGAGFGPWGDCITNATVSGYQPVADSVTGGDNFGISVSISGNYAIIGSYLDDVGANADQGSASIYQWDGSSWTLMQKITDATGDVNDYFGYSVSISGNYAIVGSVLDNVGANADQGSVSIYQRNGNSWVLMQKITDAGGAAGDQFGYSVSVSGNYAIVGSVWDDVGANTDQGSVSIYQWNGSSWTLMQKITDATGAINDYFGWSVSISGNYAIVGAPFDNVGANADQGSISTYQWNGSSWLLMQKITDATGNAGDRFGYSVSISGNYAIASAYMDDVVANANQGSVLIYQLNGSNWALMQKISDAGGSANDLFGYSVSISGNYVVVGALMDNVGANMTQGSATIYVRVGLVWQKVQYLTDPAGSTDNRFGTAVTVDGSTKRFIIGVPYYASNSGKAVFGKIN